MSRFVSTLDDFEIESGSPANKVGPKGYIHGWIYVGPQAVGGRVYHSQHGHGTVTRHEDTGGGRGTVDVKFDNGHEVSVQAKFKETARPRLYGQVDESKPLTDAEIRQHSQGFTPADMPDVGQEQPKPRGKGPVKTKPVDPYADRPYKVQGMKVLDRKSGERIGMIFHHGDRQSFDQGREFSIRHRDNTVDARFSTERDAAEEIYRREESDRDFERRVQEHMRQARAARDAKFAERRDVAARTLGSVSKAEIRHAGADAPGMQRRDKARLVTERRERILAMHGDNLRIHDDITGDAKMERHVKEFFMLPDKHHQIIADRGYQIDMGKGSVADYHPELRNVQPSGYGAGMTWDDSAGAHNPGIPGDPSRPPWMVFGNKADHASVNIVAHEMGHGIDASANPKIPRTESKLFESFHDQIRQHERNNRSNPDFVPTKPYYNATSPNRSYYSAAKEIFAESYATMMTYQGSDPSTIVDALQGTLSGIRTDDPNDKVVASLMEAYMMHMMDDIEANRSA